MSQKLNRFGRLVVAILKGDDTETKRVKIESKAVAAFNAQIAIKEARTLDLRENLENAKEKIDLTIINRGELITDREEYLINYMQAVIEKEEAEEELEQHLQDINILKKGLSFIQEQ